MTGGLPVCSSVHKAYTGGYYFILQLQRFPRCVPPSRARKGSEFAVSFAGKRRAQSCFVATVSVVTNKEMHSQITIIIITLFLEHVCVCVCTEYVHGLCPTHIIDQ